MRPALALLLLLGTLAACRTTREPAPPDPTLDARVAAIGRRAADRSAVEPGVGLRSFARGPEVGRLAPGDATEGPRLYDAYVTDLRPGDRLTADLRSEDFAPVLAVLTPSGVAHYGSAPGADDARAVLELEAAERGRYLLLVMPDADGAAGVYQLDVRSPGPVVAYPAEFLR